MTETRSIFEYTAKHPRFSFDEAELAVTAHNGAVLIEVTQERAVDSYNQEFTCSVTVPPENLDELIEFLIAARQSQSPAPIERNPDGTWKARASELTEIVEPH